MKNIRTLRDLTPDSINALHSFTTNQFNSWTLGLRLDVPLAVAGLEGAIDPDGLERMASLGLIEPAEGTLLLTPRGRLLANDVVATVIA